MDSNEVRLRCLEGFRASCSRRFNTLLIGTVNAEGGWKSCGFNNDKYEAMYLHKGIRCKITVCEINTPAPVAFSLDVQSGNVSRFVNSENWEDLLVHVFPLIDEVAEESLGKPTQGSLACSLQTLLDRLTRIESMY